MKIIIINHTFQKPQFYKRWRCLAEKHSDLDITLLAPSSWKWGKEKTLTYGHVDELAGNVVEEPRFRIHLIDTKDAIMGEYKSKRLIEEIRHIKPDIVYFIGGYTAAPLMQIIDAKKKYHLDDMKVVAFTMRGHTPTISLKKEEPGFRKYINYLGKIAILGPRYKKFKKYCDAVFCHYPDARAAFINEGYKKPIYMQTQVGVDPDVFYPDPEARKRIREKYNIGDAYLFGSASRFHYSKGVCETIRALPTEGNWKYLLMGWGRDDEVEAIKKEIAKRNLEDKIILTGFIDNWKDMAEHWNALDCAIHFPMTTSKWEETFSLALVQEMITGLPVLGSSSGSVPYQIGEEGIIVPEKDEEKLHEQMVYMMNHLEKGKEIGAKMRERALNCFSIYHLNDLFYETIQDVYAGKFDSAKVDMAEYKTKAE
ncbi:glycosyltransferase family 4 protein [Streptococcus suis]|uniref:glycosyltransferase family 4 protein n=1 Tax=Streptococcus suis TaxID=1307 RepID=UPI003F8B62E5